ncbi:hypothetical protein FQZ97_1161380 [compost metagenome]
MYDEAGSKRRRGAVPRLHNEWSPCIFRNVEKRPATQQTDGAPRIDEIDCNGRVGVEADP